MPFLSIWIVVIVVVLGLLTGYVRYELRDSSDTSVSEIDPKTETFTYESGEGYSFAYPENYVVVENPAGSGVRESLTVMTRGDYADFQGSDVPREGPTAITVEVFDNPNALSAGAWAERNPLSNFNRTFGDYKVATLGGEAAVAYRWSGLYEGESVAVSRDGRVYVFSVTWMDVSDTIRSDYRDVLASVAFD